MGMLIRFIGDVHGKWMPYRKRLRGIDYSIQVGDFGVGFPTSQRASGKVSEPPKDLQSENHRFIRGNHDNVDLCKDIPGFISDGTVDGNMMFMGGAWSIDHAYRTEGVDWWRTEENTIPDLNSFIDIYEDTKPSVMVTHDCPTEVANAFFPYFKKEGSRTRQALDAMLEIHWPNLWIFGHWHERHDMVIRGTRFICLEELGIVDVEVL